MTKPEQIEKLTEVIRDVQMENFRQSRNTYTSPEQIAEALYEAGYRMIDTKELVLKFVRYLKNGTYCDNCFRDGKWHRYLFLEDINDITKEFLQDDKS